ncbi:MAG: hypothetical protein JWO67_5233 [Streptosporangiaceae bacterium]|nr:hypothetical protein [Streptosporangiaceae bacterium]
MWDPYVQRGRCSAGLRMMAVELLELTVAHTGVWHEWLSAHHQCRAPGERRPDAPGRRGRSRACQGRRTLARRLRRSGRHRAGGTSASTETSQDTRSKTPHLGEDPCSGLPSQSVPGAARARQRRLLGSDSRDDGAGLVERARQPGDGIVGDRDFIVVSPSRARCAPGRVGHRSAI